MRNELYSLRRTQVSSLFDLVARASARFAETEGKLVRLVTTGGDVSVDRRVAERLLDPVVQLVRNAVAHGIGTPDERREAGRDPTGTIWLSAERVGVWLRVVVEDDGRGANLARIRELAVARGFVSQEVASRTERRRSACCSCSRPGSRPRRARASSPGAASGSIWCRTRCAGSAAPSA